MPFHDLLFFFLLLISLLNNSFLKRVVELFGVNEFFFLVFLSKSVLKKHHKSKDNTVCYFIYVTVFSEVGLRT